MKIPESIRIGGVDYSIVDKAGLNTGTNVAYGHIDYQKSIIELNPDIQDHQKKCLTLWHEIIHGVVEHANIDLVESNEEAIVDTIAKGVYQVLQDNGKNLFDIKESQP